MKKRNSDLRAGFQEKLDAFVFFHLGADAGLSVEEQGEFLRFDVEHTRVEPFSFTVSFDQLQTFLDDPPGLEGFLLEQLTTHRR